jgi:hypothetical protein
MRFWDWSSPCERGSFRPRQGGISRPAEAKEIVSRQAQKRDVAEIF